MSRLSRRALLALAAAGTGGAIAGAGAAGVLPDTAGRNGDAGERWPEYQGGPAHRGDTSGITPPVGPLERRWVRGPTDRDATVSVSPIVTDDSVVAPGFGGTVRAFSLGDGKSRWRAEMGRAVTATPVTDGDAVYVGSKDRSIRALDVRTGDERWRFDTGFPHTVRLVLAAGTLYAGLSEDLVAIDAATGREDWRVSVGDPDSRTRVVGSAPAVANGYVYVADYDARIYAFDASTGRARWTADFPTAYAVQHPVTVYDHTLYAGNGRGRVLAFDASTGRERWRFGLTASHVDCSLAVASGRIYAKFGGSDVGPDGRTVALDAATGDPVWTFVPEQRSDTFPPEWHRGDASPVVAGRTLHVGIGTRLYRLDTRDGAVRDWISLPSPASGSPAVADGVLVTRTRDGGFHAFAGSGRDPGP